MRLLVRSGVRFHLRRRAQLALCVLGVALGVAVVAAMWLAIDSARRGFDLSSEAVFGRVTHTLEASVPGLDENVYALLRTRLRDVPSAPVVEGPVRAAGTGHSLTLLGVDPFAEADFRDQSPLPGAVALPQLITRPGAVLASDATARRLGIKPGDDLRVFAAGRRTVLTLIGLLPVGNPGERAALDDVLVSDIATAQETLARVGRLDRIDLAAPPSLDDGSLRQRLRELLPAGVRIETGAARARVRTQMTRAFYLNLHMLSLLALVVGMFVVYNAMTFAVVQRRVLIGTLRAVGVTGREVLAMVLAEAAIIGTAATALGVPLGIALAARLTALVTRTVDDLYFSTAVRDVDLAPTALLVPVVLGIAGSVAAALVPALEATRIAPRAVLSASRSDRRARRAAPWLAAAGVGAGALACAVLAWPGGGLGAAYAALFLVVAAASLIAPAATLALSAGLQRALRRPGGVLGALALRGIRSGLSRSAVAIAALMVALAASVGVAVMTTSFRASLLDWLGHTLAADVYLRNVGGVHGEALPQSLAAHVAAVPGVVAISRSRDVEVAGPSGPVWLKAVDGDGTARYRDLHVLAGDASAVWRALDAGAVAISEPLAWRLDLRPGSRIALHTASGEHRFPVAGVFRDYGSDRGMVLMGLTQYRAWFGDGAINGIGARVDPDAGAHAVAQRLREAIAAAGLEVQVRDQVSIRDLSLAIFDRTFAITRALQWLATVVACVGVLSALMAIALERARDMAVLRTLGLTRGQLLGLLQVQTAGMGLIAGLLALPLGTVMALVLVHVINKRAFGWSMEFHVPPEVLAHTVLLAVVAALAAGAYPSWRMASTAPAQALRDT